jgi:hypothetical protein
VERLKERCSLLISNLVEPRDPPVAPTHKIFKTAEIFAHIVKQC